MMVSMVSKDCSDTFYERNFKKFPYIFCLRTGCRVPVPFVNHFVSVWVGLNFQFLFIYCDVLVKNTVFLFMTVVSQERLDLEL